MSLGTARKNTIHLPPIPRGFGAFKRWVGAAIRRIAAAAGVAVQIDGAEAASTGADGALRFKVGGGGGAAGATHPFSVSLVSGNDYQVLGGTCEGQLITTQTISVGSTYPVAILAYPQYTLGIDGGEYVNTWSVKTGSNKPVLVASTSILGDVDSGITSAGNEARALIAYIGSAGVITQITTGNIVGVFADDGTLTGKMSGHFNKNY